MSLVLTRIRRMALLQPDDIALRDASIAWSYGELNQRIHILAKQFYSCNFRVLGLLADNSMEWALADLSALAAELPVVPLPVFFSAQQLLHVIRDTGLDAILTDQVDMVAALLHRAQIDFELMESSGGLRLLRLMGVAPVQLPFDTAKITYTSGTTGEPKGVCLSQSQIEHVAVSLVDASHAEATDVHLCLTPLSTLLENIAGIYTPMLAGAQACILPLADLGISFSVLNPECMLQALHLYQVNTVILAPQMLLALVSALEHGAIRPAHLRFIAVGGAPVANQLLDRAMQLNLPVYVGYGLSECASVVALNTPHNRRMGSVGLPLPHVSISISSEGEILVSGSSCLGYLGHPPPDSLWATGDIGHLDDAGFLYITGRRKSMFVTAMGRNVSPEWVEEELTAHAAIAQAAVFGEAKPFNTVVVVIRPGYNPSDVQSAVQQVNLHLPEYAQIRATLFAHAAFSATNQQITANGRLKRQAIFAAYASDLESIYSEPYHEPYHEQF